MTHPVYYQYNQRLARELRNSRLREERMNEKTLYVKISRTTMAMAVVMRIP